jgi:hypothetical protein
MQRIKVHGLLREHTLILCARLRQQTGLMQA